MRALLAVFAHPDDESFGPGGTLARYAAEGVAVHLVCATRGGAGVNALTEADDISDLAHRRELELRCAASALNLASVQILGYRDSGMAGADANSHPKALARARIAEVSEQVAEAMDQVRPQAVLTHDAGGGYGHPDHIAVHRAVLGAWDLTHIRPREARPRKLYYVAFPRALLRLAVRVMPLIGIDPGRFGTNGDIDLRRVAAQDVPVTTRIDVRRYLDSKQRAIACHASQISGGRDRSMRLNSRIGRLLQSVETFHRAFPVASTSERVERDLFQGLT
jgi:LmbE family N-acetylglucosaminyl deacetylase